MNALRAAGSSIQVWASTMPEATMVSGRALTIAHQRPSVTTPIGTPEVAQQLFHPVDRACRPAVGRGSRSESTGSTTRTSAPVVSPRTSAPLGVTVTE